MSLFLYTSRIDYRGPDRFDITRGNGGRDGDPFAPSWAILKPALGARSLARRLPRGEAARVELQAWAQYVPAYLAEMAHSQEHHPGAWADLLARDRVVLCCFCPEIVRCHRSLLAQILERRGARWAGEIGRDGMARPVSRVMLTEVP